MSLIVFIYCIVQELLFFLFVQIFTSCMFKKILKYAHSESIHEQIVLYTNFSIAQYAPTGTECRSALGIYSFVGLSSVSLQVFL